MSFLYHTFFFDPLYNIFILLFHLLPWADAGIIVVLLTFLVRLALFPLSKKAIRTQLMMNEIAPDIAKINEKYKDNAEEKARQTLALYQKKGVNPFSGIFMLLLQLPIIFAVYRIFLHLPAIDASFLYSFVSPPAHVSTIFLGLIDVAGKSAIIAVLAALSSYLQLHIVSAKAPPPAKGSPLAAAMQSQSKFVFPIVMFFIAYHTGVVGLYFLTTNLFSAAQELYMRRHKLPRTA